MACNSSLLFMAGILLFPQNPCNFLRTRCAAIERIKESKAALVQMWEGIEVIG